MGFFTRKQILQDPAVQRHQLRHRIQRGQDGHVPGLPELLNALDAGSTTKITINNKRVNREDFEREILLPRQDDALDGYRAEYNAMLMDKVTDSSNSVAQERYITLSVHRKSVEEARTFFDRVVHDVTSRLNHLDSHSEELDAVERLRVLHDSTAPGEETEYHLDLRECMRCGHSFKDTICPDSLEFKKDHFVMGEQVWPGAVPQGVCQLHQGLHDQRADRPKPKF